MLSYVQHLFCCFFFLKTAKDNNTAKQLPVILCIYIHTSKHTKTARGGVPPLALDKYQAKYVFKTYSPYLRA